MDSALPDEVDRAIVNELQQGLPISERPFAELAARLRMSEERLLDRLRHMRESGLLTRFGPLFNAERMGGALSLCALAAPADRFERVAELVNSFPEVAHNYARDHRLNMWFVIATETPLRVAEVIRAIDESTGCRVYDFPKREEFYVGLYLPG